jgi:hypothetical protein
MNIVPVDNDDLERLLLARNPSFQALMARAQESIRTGKTLPSDEFWRLAHARAAARAASPAPFPSSLSTPAIAEPRVDYRTSEE